MNLLRLRQLFYRFQNIIDPANGWYDKDNDTVVVEAEISAECEASSFYMVPLVSTHNSSSFCIF